MRQLCKLDTVRDLGIWKDMCGNKRGEFCVHVQGVHRGDGFGERSGMAEADGGRHDGEGCRTAI